jgi:hypothetical protein
MKKLQKDSFVPITELVLYFGEGENQIEVIVDEINTNGDTPTITVCSHGQAGFPEEMRSNPVDEDTRKKYTDYVLQLINEEKIKLPRIITLDVFTGVVEIDECI